MSSPTQVHQKLREPYFIYLVVVSLVGLILSIWGLFSLFQHDSYLNYLLLLILAVSAQFSTTSVPVTGKGGITYQVAPAIVVASIPMFGPAAAALLNSLSALSLWLIKPVDKTTWKKSKEQLFFNMGMSAISVFLAGLVFAVVRGWLEGFPLLSAMIPWLITAAVYDQVNLWLVLVIIRLQSGPGFKLLEAWKGNAWAILISITLMTVGGGLLAFAIQEFDWLGIIIFFLPIILSAFAFRIYVGQMQAHMDNLEAIIANRTNDLAHAVEELEDTNQQLKLLSDEKNAFLAVLTHDMKSPLTSINVYATLLKKNPEILTERPYLSDVILRSHQTLLDIVNNILDLELLNSPNTMQLKKEKLDLSYVTRVTAQLMEAQAMDKEITLEVHADDPTIIIDADRKQVERIITNLISNAIKYTAEGGQVWVSVKSEGNSALLTIKDTGYGIPAAELSYIFDRFRRVSKHENVASGTGLGLAITKGLTEAHGGEISVASEEGEGSIFIVTLPLAV